MFRVRDSTSKFFGLGQGILLLFTAIHIIYTLHTEIIQVNTGKMSDMLRIGIR